MRSLFVVLPMVFLSVGCVAHSTDPAFMASGEHLSRPAATESLFPGDEEVLSGESIDKILNSRVVIPENVRMVVFRMPENSRWRWWSENFAQLDDDARNAFVAKLEGASGLRDVSFLPSLMAPRRQTVPYLREAAARYQAHLLLVYKTSSWVFDKYRVFAPDEAKAQCTVEAVLLDVRTGLVPFSSVSRQQFIARKTKDDYSFSETMARAEMQAVGKGLIEIASDLVSFLEEVQQPGGQAGD